MKPVIDLVLTILAVMVTALLVLAWLARPS